MSSYEEEINDQQSDNMEQEENKVDVEQTTINLGCVKEELEEGEYDFDENRYKLALTFDNLFGDTWKEQRDNRDSLIGFLDDQVIMETGCIKLEDVKEEEDLIREIMGQSDCNKCGANYERYCPDCSSLSHILNNLTPNIKPEPILNTMPIDMLQIREISTGQAVFAVKTLPKGIIIGPFEGLTPIESTTGLQWKIKDKKLVNDQNGNWMKYIESVANHASKNLDVFQFDGILYFETSREIHEGEELLVCYCEEKDEVLKSDKQEEFYLIPVKKEKYPKVFACTRCCLGFRLEKCLMEHKSKCPQGDHGGSSEDFEIIQCPCCKVWLEKQEHLGSHMLHCLENYNRLCRNPNLPDFEPTYIGKEEKVHEHDEISTSINASYSTHPKEMDSNNSFSRNDVKVHKERYSHHDNMGTTHLNTSEKTYKSSECSYQTKRKSNLKIHRSTHDNITSFECDMCKKRFKHKISLKRHIRDAHSNRSEKEYKCSECAYQTNRKGNLKIHRNTHDDIKSFECDICKKRFKHKSNLHKHIRDVHSNRSEKEYKSSECAYQTNRKGNLKTHRSTHDVTKSFECDICKKRFKHKSNLHKHIRDAHSNRSEKEYKCSECAYQTNSKIHLKIHRSTHDDIKSFECDICKKRFKHKISLKPHIRDAHSNRSEKEYKCSECAYQTNRKGNLKIHRSTHDDIKSFECDFCKKRFKHKSNLHKHIRDAHSNRSEKVYKCSECAYQTNSKSHLKIHRSTHDDIKSSECNICKKRFKHKISLKPHIRDAHSNRSEKEYKCSECTYQTNRKGNLKIHRSTHDDIKSFECDICKKRFKHKSNLYKHIRDAHSNRSEKEYKCSKI